MHDEGNLYLIKHLQLITGLTDRTIRSYLASGILQGEKINGLWHFTPEQVDAFVYHPAVRPSIQAKRNSIVYDHMLNTEKGKATACVVLNIPGSDQRKVAEFFSYSVRWEDCRDVRFCYDAMKNMSRVILSGDAEQVFRILDSYRSAF